MGTARPASDIPPAGRAADRGLELLVLLGSLGLRLTAAMTANLGGLALSGNAPVLVICALALRGTIRPADVRRLTGLTSGGATRLVDRLVELGLVERSERRDRTDRRAIFLSLTPGGRDAAARLSAAARSQDDVVRDAAERALALIGGASP